MLLGREGEIQNMGQGGNYLRLWEELNEAVPNQRQYEMMEIEKFAV